MQRDVLIDITKGLGILLVVLAHTYSGGLQDIIYYFHMPLFFVLTGCALTYSKTNDIKWKRLFKGILVPYLVFSLFMFVYWSLIESKFRPIHDGNVIPWLSNIISFKTQQFVNIFIAMDSQDAFIYDIVLWYLPCLLMCRILYSKINKTKYPLVGVTVLACAGIVLSNILNISLPWCLELSFVALPFIFLGHKFYTKLSESISRGVAVCCILIGGGILFLLNTRTDISINMLGHDFAYGWIYLTAIVGSLTMLCMCYLLKDTVINKPLAFLGKNSLLIMCLHEPLKRIIIKILSAVIGYDTDVLRGDFILSLIVVVVTVALLLPCIYSINKWIPWTAGK